MNIEFLKKLSNADGIAGNESEVRSVLMNEVKEMNVNSCNDGLGSLVFTKDSSHSDLNIMICAHMDEVGFMVRSISDLGLIHLMTVGGVKPLAQHLQKIRITTEEGKKISGIINGTYIDNETKDLYCDIGATSSKEVEELGIEVGNMVTYATEFESFDLSDIYAGKAMDNRLACFIIGELIKELNEEELNCNVHFAATSSEEVGIRGAKTTTQMINPDVVFVIDVATASSQFIRDHQNQRQIGNGPILTHFDRTLVPNKGLLNYVKKIAKKRNISLQLDMFNSGGTDGGEAHKVNEGKPTVVNIVPVRYGHCAYSIVNKNDIRQMIELYKSIIRNFNKEVYEKIINFN